MSTGSIQNSSPTLWCGPVARVPLGNYVKVLGPTDTVDSSYSDVMAFLTANSAHATEVTNGGRVFLAGQTALQQVEILPLFTTSGATASFQLHAMDAVFLQDNDATRPNGTGDQHKPIPNQLVSLGMPYPLAMDQTTSLSSIVETFDTKAGSSTVKLSFGSGNGKVYIDNASGTTYYIGVRHIVERGGAWAILPVLTALSAGNVVLLAKAV